MDNNIKMLLQQEKMQLKIKQKAMEIQQIKDNFSQNIEHFTAKYRYANTDEIDKINVFIDKLTFISP